MSRFDRLCPLLALCTGLLACDRAGEQEPPPTDTPPAASPGERTGPAPEAAPASAPSTPNVAAPADPKAHMRAHYLVALELRDALIAGKHSRSEPPARFLASHAYPESLPAAWRSHAGRMQEIARAIQTADDARAAARDLGRLAAACGGCHRAMGTGPKREPSGFTELSAEGLRERMHRHGWAAERMWDGLIGPWEQSFEVGAEVLADGRLDLKVTGPKANAALSAGLKRVRDIGQRARGAQDDAQRAELLGELLATCSGCHQALKVELSDDEPAPSVVGP